MINKTFIALLLSTVLRITNAYGDTPLNESSTCFNGFSNQFVHQTFLIAQNIPLKMSMSEVSEAISSEALEKNITPSISEQYNHLIIEHTKIKMGDYTLNVYKPILVSGSPSTQHRNKKDFIKLTSKWIQFAKEQMHKRREWDLADLEYIDKISEQYILYSNHYTVEDLDERLLSTFRSINIPHESVLIDPINQPFFSKRQRTLKHFQGGISEVSLYADADEFKEISEYKNFAYGVPNIFLWNQDLFHLQTTETPEKKRNHNRLKIFIDKLNQSTEQALDDETIQNQPLAHLPVENLFFDNIIETMTDSKGFLPKKSIIHQVIVPDQSNKTPSKINYAFNVPGNSVIEFGSCITSEVGNFALLEELDKEQHKEVLGLIFMGFIFEELLNNSKDVQFNMLSRRIYAYGPKSSELLFRYLGGFEVLEEITPIEWQGDTTKILVSNPIKIVKNFLKHHPMLGGHYNNQIRKRLRSYFKKDFTNEKIQPISQEEEKFQSLMKKEFKTKWSLSVFAHRSLDTLLSILDRIIPK